MRMRLSAFASAELAGDRSAGTLPTDQPNPIASTVTAAVASNARPDGDPRPGQSTTDRLRSMA